MSLLTRRSFLAAAATAASVPAHSLSAAPAPAKAKAIPGFDQTQTAADTSQPWQPFSDRKVRVGIVGHGVCKFGLQFGLQHHPNAELVAVSDLFPDRCAEMARLAKCPKTYPSLEEMVKDDSIEAIFCATDAPSHAKHAILCLEHGKHVAVAVPAFRGDIDDAERLLQCCRKNRGLVFAMFETSCFHDDLYAMEKLYAAGVFGRIIYAEGEYCHPRSVGAPALDSYLDWRKKGCPMWYPTHATAYYVGVTHRSFLDVSCQGTPDFDPALRVPNAIGNTFKSEVAMLRTAEGGIARMIVCYSQGEYLEAGRLRGEYGGYHQTFTGDKTGTRRHHEALKGGLRLRKYALPPGVKSGGHGGSHGYLGDDFIDAILRGRPPRVGVIDALNMTTPGYYAHLSALRDGETLKIPQYTL
jgi:predicted dehydrogenase